MKYVLTVVLMVGMLFSTTTLIVEDAIIDDGVVSISPGSGLRQGTMVDSCGNQYSLALTNHESCAYDPMNDVIGIVNRNFSPTGVLNYHSAPGDLSFWVHDYAVYNQDFGAGRYPTAVAGTTGPYMSFPWLTSVPAWGGAGGQYGSGGWYSAFWDDPVDLMPGDDEIQTVIAKELPTGDICFICYDTSPYGFSYRTYSPDLLTQVAGGRLTPAANLRYYVGWDCNLTAGIATIMYCELDLSMYYQTTTDGVTWSGEQTFNFVWPNPYSNNELSLNNGLQTALTDAGDPLTVFANMNGDNLEYPQDGKIYVCHTEGQPCVEVSDPAVAKNFYPTISAAGNYAVVTYLTPRDAQMDSATFHDMWSTFSTDNGVTWSTPVNETYWSTQRISFPQLAKRFDVSRTRAYGVYATCRLASEDMDLMWAYDNGVAPNIYVNLLTVETGIEEHKTEIPSRFIMNVTNPASHNAKISYALTDAGEISLKVYDRTGSMVRAIETGYKEAGIYSLNLNVDELPNGAYLVHLTTSAGDLTRTLIVIH